MNELRQQIYLGILIRNLGEFVSQIKKGDNQEFSSQQFLRECFSDIELIKNDIEKIFRDRNVNEPFARLTNQIISVENISKQKRGYLTSVLSEINLGEKRNEMGVYYYAPGQINEFSCIPLKDSTKRSSVNCIIDENVNKHLQEFDQFQTEIRKIRQIKDYASLLTTIYALLNKYTTNISINPGISLFDHSRTVAGLVNCLSAIHPENETNANQKEEINTEFVFLKGEITGIHKFIYSDTNQVKTIQNNVLSGCLRGRTFYIRLITDLFIEMFTREFEIAEVNVLYAGGGHFYMILPKSHDYKARIDKITKEINLFLYDKFNSNVSFVTGFTECDKELYTRANEIFRKVAFEIAKKKNKKNEGFLDELFFSKSENLIFTEDEVIGKLITHADFLIQIEAIEGVRIEADESLIAGFPCFNKYYFAITDNLDSSIKDYDFIYRFFNTRKNFIKSARIIRLNNSDFLEHAENLLRDFKFPISFTFRYSGYEFQNDKNGKISGFKEMEGLECTSFPIGSNPPQLAAMKLDMDNLESIFEIGLGYKAPISKIATLSRLMDNFFSVYIKSLSKEFDIYIAYSGGDDVLVIGDWYKIIHFARALYTKFNEFSCNNPNLTFSAGVFICNENYLLSKVADKADEQLKLSKNYINQEGKKKNAITIFDHTLTWDRFSKMLDFAEKLLLYTNVEGAKNKEKLASSLVQRLFNIIKSSLDNQGCVNTDKLYRKVAELHYLFARHGFTSANIVEARDGIARDIISLILCDFSKKEIIKDYLIPVNYVILKNRSVNKKIP